MLTRVAINPFMLGDRMYQCRKTVTLLGETGFILKMGNEFKKLGKVYNEYEGNLRHYNYLKSQCGVKREVLKLWRDRVIESGRKNGIQTNVKRRKDKGH